MYINRRVNCVFYSIELVYFAFHFVFKSLKSRVCDVILKKSFGSDDKRLIKERDGVETSGDGSGDDIESSGSDEIDSQAAPPQTHNEGSGISPGQIINEESDFEFVESGSGEQPNDAPPVRVCDQNGGQDLSLLGKAKYRIWFTVKGAWVRIPVRACEKVGSDLGLGGGLYSGFLHYLQLASHELSTIWILNKLF